MDIVYSFTRGEEALAVELGKTHPKLDAWISSDECDRWMVLTAENPWGEEFPFFVNKQRTQVLRTQLQETELHWVEGLGEADGFPSEKVFLIWGLTLEESALLALEMSQTAVVTGLVGGYAEVISLHDGGGE